jgi:uncharacterized protein YeaO (DUF488 family)
MVKVKRIYAEPSDDDGRRVLVDRLWPRGINKDAAHLAAWLKDLAPSDELRRWFSHDPQRWRAFYRRYLQELQDPAKAQLLQNLLDQARRGTVTLVFAAKDEERNNAVVMKTYLDDRLNYPLW